jgi:putative flippase GtrA
VAVTHRLAVGVSPSRENGRVATVMQRLRAETDGRRSLLGSFVRWGVTGAASVVTDVGLLALLHSGFGFSLLGSTVVAYLAGVAVNYTLNRNWTFQTTAGHREVLVRYAALVVFNGVTTVLIVHGLHQLGVFYLLAKLVAVAINASINFLAGRYWVFAPASD